MVEKYIGIFKLVKRFESSKSLRGEGSADRQTDAQTDKDLARQQEARRLSTLGD